MRKAFYQGLQAVVVGFLKRFGRGRARIVEKITVYKLWVRFVQGFLQGFRRVFLLRVYTVLERVVQGFIRVYKCFFAFM